MTKKTVFYSIIALVITVAFLFGVSSVFAIGLTEQCNSTGFHGIPICPDSLYNLQ